ncbi:enamine deaminase RidA (YjgF/YER057c/UK114 family) [Lachnotalea glycerini]|nr:RidA family protein [Lachnotalea glycerini]PXV86878.1 enamine deaminase RidA (YjgF/YER057c/UK114 family) [Lachnotalea glycerini]
MMDVYQILKEKGIILPSPPPKGGIYSPVMNFSTNLLYCSGCGCDIGDGKSFVGKLGREFTIEQGQEAAYNCVLNLLANLDAKLGDLNRIKKFVKILAFVNSTEDFEQQPMVVNGGSKLLLDIFGSEAGLPARTAVGCNTLPDGIACEMEVLLEIKDL